MSALAVLWFFLIFVLIAGYFVLDGFDLGVGVLYRALAKTDAERVLVRRSIGPVWDGNEVWLLTAGGALFAAFPAAYATTFSGFYLAVMLVLFGLIVRAVSLEFGAHDPKWGRAWDACFTIGSFLPALLLGVALGNVIAGVPLAANGDYAGVPLLGLLSPFTLVVGALGFAMCMAAGAAWVALKTERTSAVHGRAEKQRRVWHVVALALFVVATVLAFAVVKPQFAPGMLVAGAIFAIVFVVCIAASIVQAKRGNDLAAFVLQSIAAVCLVALTAVSLFPNLVVAAPGSVGESITLMNAASSDTSLAWMTGIACIGVPLVLVYHVIAYRVFSGRLAEEDVA
ncbi:MAG: cytochrome d ubiquinol oxidase subunit II [Coriobacteriia bacterium]|nr:MAG: cytochrome d ubiquinol oxidase subunit II [Coriobacteriia bacterium]